MIGWIPWARARRRLRALERLGRDPQGPQEAMLLRMVAEAARTRFGRDHGFDSIRTVEDFRERVPLQDHASMRPYLERAQGGAGDETWPGAPVAFAVSSGRALPYTPSSVRSFLGGAADALAAYLVRARDRSLPGRTIAVLGGGARLGDLPSGAPLGDGKGLLATRAPLRVRPFLAPSAAVRALADWEWKLDATAKELARRDVRVLVGAPSWSLLLVDRVERVAGRPIRDVWPSWRGLLHGGVAFAPYAETWRKRVGRDLVLVESYAATAGGVLAVEDREGDPSLALLPDRNVYFELVRDGRRLGVHEAEAGVPYRLHVTTDQGLWGYATGDVVRFTATRPPRIVVEGGRFLLNAFGERVTGEALEGALAAAARECACEVEAFAVEPEFPAVTEPRGRHRWIVECGEPPADLDAFARAVDAALRGESAEYRAHRLRDVQLLPPRVRLVRRGAFDAWRRDRGLAAVPRVLPPGEGAVIS